MLETIQLYELLVLDWNTWNNTTVWIIRIKSKYLKQYNSVQIIYIR